MRFLIKARNGFRALAGRARAGLRAETGQKGSYYRNLSEYFGGGVGEQAIKNYKCKIQNGKTSNGSGSSGLRRFMTVYGGR